MAFSAIINNPTATLPFVGDLPGALWTWGFNGDAETGDGNQTSPKITPAAMATHTFVKVAYGRRHAIGLKSDGSVWTWGENISGALGTGDTTLRNVPYDIGITGALDVAGGWSFSVILKSDGSMWGSGTNGYGQLGTGGGAVTSFTAATGGNFFTKIACGSDPFGSDSTIALKSSGEVWGCGDSTYGQTNGTTLSKLSSGSDIYREVYSAGISVMAIKTSDDQAYGRGYNGTGALGTGNNTNQSTFTVQAGGNTYSKLALGVRFGLGLKIDGSVYGWGAPISGIFTPSSSTPASIFAGPYTDLACNPFDNGGCTASVLDASGNMYSWGDNTLYNFGTTSASPSSSASLVASVSGTTFTRLLKTQSFTNGAIKV